VIARRSAILLRARIISQHVYLERIVFDDEDGGNGLGASAAADYIITSAKQKSARYRTAGCAD
jgi:hypothetical protein